MMCLNIPAQRTAKLILAKRALVIVMVRISLALREVLGGDGALGGDGVSVDLLVLFALGVRAALVLSPHFRYVAIPAAMAAAILC